MDTSEWKIRRRKIHCTFVRHDSIQMVWYNFFWFAGRWLWFGPIFRHSCPYLHSWDCYVVVPCTRSSARLSALRMSCWRLVHWLYFRWNGNTQTSFPGWLGDRSTIPNFPVSKLFLMTISINCYSYLSEFWRLQQMKFGQVWQGFLTTRQLFHVGHRISCRLK